MNKKEGKKIIGMNRELMQPCARKKYIDNIKVNISKNNCRATDESFKILVIIK